MNATCLAPPQFLSTPDSSLTLGICGAVLEPSAGVCCSQERLNELDRESNNWQQRYTPVCYVAYLRFRCAVACSSELHRWWDPALNRAHLCEELSTDLWDHCFAGGTRADVWFLDNGTAFAAFNTGPGRADESVRSSCDQTHTDAATHTRSSHRSISLARRLALGTSTPVCPRHRLHRPLSPRTHLSRRACLRPRRPRRTSSPRIGQEVSSVSPPSSSSSTSCTRGYTMHPTSETSARSERVPATSKSSLADLPPQPQRRPPPRRRVGGGQAPGA